MDVTLVRQGTCRTETENGEFFESLPSDEIVSISKSALRLMYACGKRPLWVNNGKDDWKITVENKPQAQPDCILCGSTVSGIKSARIFQKQLRHLGSSVGLIQLKSLSETALSKEHLKRFYMNLIQNSFDSLEKKGLKHIVVVAAEKELDAISCALTGIEKTLDKNVAMRMIRKGKHAGDFNPYNTDYITEGIYETMLNHHIKGENCSEDLKKFKGKVRSLIGAEYLSKKFRKRMART